MAIKIKKSKTNKIIKETTVNKKNIYTIEWKNIIPDNFIIITEKLFFNFDLDIEYEENTKNNKIILIGQYNNKFWFFKIIKDSYKYSYEFSVKKPLLENIDNLRISIFDWYGIIKKIEPEKLEVEYAISKDI